MLRVELRPEISTLRSAASPVLALAATCVVGAVLFLCLGKDPARGLELFFVEPVSSAGSLSELAVKATPLLLIAVGLSIAFRANVWNIGAEGQFVLGAIGSGGLAMRMPPEAGHWVIVPILVAGALGGMLWAAIVAALRDHFHANEILVSLMLVYVAELLLDYLVYGPWRDPQGYNFPQTITFPANTAVPRLFDGYRAHAGAILALVVVAVGAVFLFRTYGGFRLQVGGASAAAARFAGFSARASLWTALLVSGATAGLAGGLEVCGPIGQLNPYVPAGYGFAAIIVAFVGRLHPAGVVLSSVLMSMFYLGGELCQSRMGLPKALTGVFQGLLLLTLLVCDGLVRYRVRWTSPAAVALPAPLPVVAASDALPTTAASVASDPEH
jgi:simple sugar transport system permease protein